MVLLCGLHIVHCHNKLPENAMELPVRRFKGFIKNDLIKKATIIYTTCSSPLLRLLFCLKNLDAHHEHVLKT